MHDGRKPLNNLDQFLQKFRHIIPRETLIKDAFIQVIHEIFSLSLNKKEITVRGKIIFLSTSPIIKQEIFLQKENILKLLSEKVGENFITEIK